MKKTPQEMKTGLLQKVKAALHVYTQSLTSIKYYQNLIKTDLRFSLKYYVVLAVLFTLVNSFFSTVQILPKLQKGINDAMSYALDLYEDDLVVTIQDGSLSINKEEPYIVPLIGVGGTSGVAKNLVVFDSKSGLDDLEDTYDTLVLVNGTNILVRNSSKVEVMPIKDLPDVTITKADFAAGIAKIQSLAKFVPYFVGLAFILAMLFYYLVYRLIYLVFVGLLLWVVGAFRGLNLPYSKYYKVALHSMSLPLTVGLINSVIQTNIYFPSWFFLLNAIFGVLVVVSLEAGEIGEGEGDSAGGGEGVEAAEGEGAGKGNDGSSVSEDSTDNSFDGPDAQENSEKTEEPEVLEGEKIN